MLNKILLTGGAGLIGKSLASELLKNNYKVSILDLPKQVSRNKKFFKSNPKVNVNHLYDLKNLFKNLLVDFLVISE